MDSFIGKDTHWNYRILKRVSGETAWYSIYEVYYEEGSPIMCSSEPVYAYHEEGDDGSLSKDMELQRKALNMSVLNYADFTNNKRKKAFK